MDPISTSIVKRVYDSNLDLNAEPSKKKTKADVTTTHWYENLPKDDAIDDSQFKDAFDNILMSISEELRILSIETIVERFKTILPEFYDLSSNYRINAPKYNAVFEEFLLQICKIYNINFEALKGSVVVYPGKYSVEDWGPVYWDFLHLSSILISHAFETNMVGSLLNFPLLVYQIDNILPCVKCAHHYSMIKETPDVKQIIQRLAFGSTIYAMQIFHNVVTKNIDTTPEYTNRPNRDPFLMPDFALKYKCIDIQNEMTKKATNYTQSCIDWQPTTHVLLSTILSTYCSQPYDRTSNLLKYRLYSKNKHFANINLQVRNNDVRPIDSADLAYISMSEKQIQYCLMRALILQFQDTNVDQAQLEKNKRFNFAVVTLYKKFNNEIKDIVSKNLTEPNQMELRKSLLFKIDKVKDLDIESRY